MQPTRCGVWLSQQRGGTYRWQHAFMGPVSCTHPLTAVGQYAARCWAAQPTSTPVLCAVGLLGVTQLHTAIVYFIDHRNRYAMLPCAFVASVCLSVCVLVACQAAWPSPWRCVVRRCVLLTSQQPWLVRHRSATRQLWRQAALQLRWHQSLRRWTSSE